MNLPVPQTADAKAPALCIEKTIIGMALSRAKATADVSITRRSRDSTSWNDPVCIRGFSRLFR